MLLFSGENYLCAVCTQFFLLEDDCKTKTTGSFGDGGLGNVCQCINHITSKTGAQMRLQAEMVF